MGREAGMNATIHGVTANGHRHFTIQVGAYIFGASAEGWLLVEGQVSTDPDALEAATQAYAAALEAWGVGPATALERGLRELEGARG